MKTIKVQGKVLRSEDYFIESAIEVEEGIEVNTPSLLMNLVRLRRKIRESFLENNRGFEYSFPLAFDYRDDSNGFKASFPLIFG